MDKYTATEMAFKHGYEKGYEAAKAEIVHCKDCKHYDKDALWCNINSHAFGEPFYNWYEEDSCSYGEKIVKPNISKQTADALNKMGKAVHGGNNG
jgi:hypothetical protein